MPMHAGDLIYRVELQRNQPTQSPSGQLLESWGTFATVWAAVSAVSGTEPFVPPQFAAKSVGQIDIRYSSDVNSLGPEDRIIFPAGSTSPKAICNIINVSEIGRREGLRILIYKRGDE